MKLRAAFVIAAVLCMLGMTTVWGFGSLMAQPHVAPVPAPTPPGRLVHIVSSDGVRLGGSYWPGRQPKGPAVLLLHGINSSRASFTRHALWLNGLGYAVLAIDLRGHGGSAAVPRSFGLHESRDAAAALAFLRKGEPGRRIGVIGTSLGGASALLGDDGPLPVQAMVLQAVYPDLRRAISNRIVNVAGEPVAWLTEPLLSYQSWPRYGVPPDRIAPIAGLRRFTGPVLIIGGVDDTSTTAGDTRAFFEAAPGPKRLWLIEGTGHAATGSIFNDDYRKRVQALFETSLGPA
ncbi:MAG TPA: alpha/beta fold hydrolase [Sphingomicrobium sp.]|nr:alpha/beta fold hydrolase [Sphingomicrobium sp.]